VRWYILACFALTLAAQAETYRMPDADAADPEAKQLRLTVGKSLVESPVIIQEATP
jgi:hypothetical protein